VVRATLVFFYQLEYKGMPLFFGGERAKYVYKSFLSMIVGNIIKLALSKYHICNAKQ
jgi:hypothetical protein